MSLTWHQHDFYLLSYLDVYSRAIVFFKLCSSMTGDTIKEVTREAPAQIIISSVLCLVLDFYIKLSSFFTCFIIHPGTNSNSNHQPYW